MSHNSSVNCTHACISKMNGSLTLMNTCIIKILIFPQQSVTNVHTVLQVYSGRTNSDMRIPGLGYRLGSEH